MEKLGLQIVTFYSNSLPVVFFLVFQGFDWTSGSVDPNPWRWMSGSIRKGIGKDGCSERDQFSRIQISLISVLINRSPGATFFFFSPLGPRCLFKVFQW